MSPARAAVTVDGPTTLTRIDVQTLELSSLGMSTKEIAKHLGEKPQAINSRVTRAQFKMGARNRTHAVALAMASGLICGPEPVQAVASSQRTLAEFAEDYKILSARGLNHTRIAEALGLKKSTVERTLWRARKAGLLPPPGRVEVASC